MSHHLTQPEEVDQAFREISGDDRAVDAQVTDDVQPGVTTHDLEYSKVNVTLPKSAKNKTKAV